MCNVWFQEMLDSDEYEFRYKCGVAKPSCRISLSEKKKVIDAFCLHYSVLASLAELEQLRRGFSIHKFDSLLQNYPEIMYEAFQPSDYQLTSRYIRDLFKPLFSSKGSNNRELEEAIVMTWILYLQNQEGMYNNFIVRTLIIYNYYYVYFMC